MSVRSAPTHSQALRAQKEDSDVDVSLSGRSASPSGLSDPGAGSEGAVSDVESLGSESQRRGKSDLQDELRQISFGALADAQSVESAGQPSRSGREQLRRRDRSPSLRDRPASRTDAEKVNTLRSRLAELKDLKTRRTASSVVKDPSSKEPSSNVHGRSSKHAPVEQTSRRAVTRFRPAIEVAQNPYHSRDPRFSSITTDQQPFNNDRFRHNYAFLTTYREDEVAKLRLALDALKKKKRRTAAEEAEIDSLKRNINSIENKLKAEKEKERQREIVRSHKKEERSKVQQGKKPYFLKNSELKKRAMTERMEGMKAKEREKVLQRRRKKESQRERRAMPSNRRAVNT